MKKRNLSSYLFICLFLTATWIWADTSVHVGIHRHLHQPIYWGEPDEQQGRLSQVQFGYGSQKNKDANNAYYGDTIQHPDNLLVGGNDSVFEDPDKVNAYQNWIKGSIQRMNHLDAGMTISFSGALQRNLWDFGKDSAYGYSPGWNNQNKEAYGWTTSSGTSKAEVLGQTYNHAFSPLLPKTVLRKQIQMHKERTRKSWDTSVDSKGFWPIELAFSRHMIDVLIEEGYEWVMVGNSHIARTCQNYTGKAEAAGLLNSDPPNKADLLGPNVPDDQWYNANRDSYGNAFPVPFAYQLHKAKYVNPETAAESKITVVPQCDYHGYQSGYSAVGWSFIDGKISQYNDPAKPSLVMLTNDGENFWGGGNSFWMEFAGNFMNEAGDHGKKPTTIGQFVTEHPADDNDVIHVEDGSWLAADQGSPQFYRWLEPPRRISGVDLTDPLTFYDLENGWHNDMRNWAVMYAGINYCETAEQIYTDGGGEVYSWRIEEPYQDNGTWNNPNDAEQAWHFLMWGFDSGFIYFDPSDNDDEIKHTFAANRAISIAQNVIGDASQDATPPTVFKPQRFPWNPGGKGRGQYLSNYTGHYPIGYGNDPWSSDFYVWSLIFDVSGMGDVNLMVRVDDDGVNPLNNNANETYAGGVGVGGWISVPMTQRSLPKNDPTNNSGLNYFREPDHIAYYYWAKLDCFRGQLVDYYIEARDSKGNLQKSEIQHVYVEDDGTPASGSCGNVDAQVGFTPATPDNCSNSTVQVGYQPNQGPLAGASTIHAAYTIDAWVTSDTAAMTANGSLYEVTLNIPVGATNMEVAFNDGGAIWDNNNNQNWTLTITDCPGAEILLITNPPNNRIVSNAVVSYVLEGYIATNRTTQRSLTWSNQLTGEVGLQYAGANWSINPGISLDVGINAIEVNAFYINQLAYDIASNYTLGWSGNEGFGFGAWNLWTSGANAGHFIADSSNASLDGAPKAFGLWANSGDDANALRTFDNPLSFGETAYIDIENGFIDTGSIVGLYFQNSSGETLFGVRFEGGKTGYEIIDSTGIRITGVGFTDHELRIGLSPLTGGGYRAEIGNTNYSGDLVVSTNQVITQALIANQNAGSGDDYNLYILSMQIVGISDAPFSTDQVNIIRQGLTVDSDFDGIDDAWEMTHFSDLTTANAISDADEDGFADLSEYIAGTDPNDPDKHLLISKIEWTGTGNKLYWPSVADKMYSVYFTTNLNSGFTVLQDDLSASPATNSFMDTHHNGIPRCYYRVGVRR